MARSRNHCVLVIFLTIQRVLTPNERPGHFRSFEWVRTQTCCKQRKYTGRLSCQCCNYGVDRILSPFKFHRSRCRGFYCHALERLRGTRRCSERWSVFGPPESYRSPGSWRISPVMQTSHRDENVPGRARSSNTEKEREVSSLIEKCRENPRISSKQWFSYKPRFYRYRHIVPAPQMTVMTKSQRKDNFARARGTFGAVDTAHLLSLFLPAWLCVKCIRVIMSNTS
jgi:hypothetical protein